LPLECVPVWLFVCSSLLVLMNRALISIAVLLLFLLGCNGHWDQGAARADQEPTRITSLPPAGSVQPESMRKVASEPQTLDRSSPSRPSPFAVTSFQPELLTKVASEPQILDRSSLSGPSPFLGHPEPEPLHAALSQSAPIAPAPPAATHPIRAKIAARLEQDRKPLKTFIPKVADPSPDPVALLPGPPALAITTQNPASTLILGRKTCCVGTATFEPAQPSRLQRVLGTVPGIRRIHRNPENAEGYVVSRPARAITLVLPPEASAALTRGTMDLKATVDASGRVTRVELLSPKDGELVRLAAYAASAWPFIPAKVNYRAVTSEVILHFTFSGN
jgi:hypothetical protein